MMKHSIKKAFMAISAALSISICAAQSNFDQLDQFMDTLAKHDKAMVAVALRQQGKLVYSRQIGFADVDKQVKLGADSVFRVGSISKIYTAAAVMKLVEQGKLKLNGSLAQFYPQIVNAKDITLEHLLRHRSGIFNLTDDPAYLNYMTEAKSKQELLTIIADFQSQFSPGSSYQYSNSNYVLLSFIIEDVTGQPFAEALSELVFNPLQLANTRLGAAINPKQQEVYSYRYAGNWTKTPETDMSIPLGAGAVISTAEDTSLFLHKLFQGHLLSTNSLTQMKEFTDNYGLGLMRFPFSEKWGLGHSGGIDGFLSNAAYFEPDQVSMTVLSNGINLNFNDILIAVLSSQFGRDFDIPDFSVQMMALSAQKAEAYLGEYDSSDLPLGINVFYQNEQLMAQATGQGAFPLTLMDNGEFRFDQAGITIVFSESKQDFTLIQGGARYRYSRK